MANQIKNISCNDLDIMASIEGQIVNKHSFYHPSILLMYVKKGVLHIEIENRAYAVERGNFVLIDKCTNGFMEKSWSVEEQEACVYAFVFHQQFIEKVRQQFAESMLQDKNDIEPVYVLPPNLILNGLFDSIVGYLDEEQELDKSLVELKTLEAMMGILKYHPRCYGLFLEENEFERANIKLLIENNYMYNVPLSKLAELSGRSPSTFYREFKAIYKESPSRWIRKRRLIKAKELLLNTNRRPVDFYLDIGFESLAHFSRAFKKEFGLTMTDFRKNNHSKIN